MILNGRDEQIFQRRPNELDTANVQPGAAHAIQNRLNLGGLDRRNAQCVAGELDFRHRRITIAQKRIEL